MMRRLTGVAAVLAFATACGGDDQQPGGETAGTDTGGAAGASQAGNAGKSSTGGASAGTSQGGASSGGSDDGGATQGGKHSGGQAGAETGGAGGGGGSGGGGTGSGGQATTPEALMPIVTAYCATARACCKDEADVDLDDCETEFAMKNETVGSLMRGAVTLDIAGLEACRAAYVAAATTCEMNGVLAACRGLVHGKIADGAACSLGSECAGMPAPNTCLITEVNGTVGICKATPHAKLNEECFSTARKGELYASTTYGATDSELAMCFEDEGFYCDYDVEPSKCQALRATGADCTDDDQCGSDSYCDYVDTGKCKKRSQLNEPCGLDLGYCIPQLSCVDNKCKSPPFAAGSSCLGYSLGPY